MVNRIGCHKSNKNKKKELFYEESHGNVNGPKKSYKSNDKIKFRSHLHILFGPCPYFYDNYNHMLYAIKNMAFPYSSPTPNPHSP